MIDELAIGSILWLRSDNFRTYDKETNKIIPEKTFRVTSIISETIQSWVTLEGYKYPKRYKNDEPHAISERGYTVGDLFTENGKSLWLWENVNRYKIARLVERATIPQLKEIAKIMESK